MTIPFHTWLTDPLEPDVRAALQRLARHPAACHIAVMPDVHLAHDVCIGTVLATEDVVFADAVGNDIGCGVAAMGFQADAEIIDRESAPLLLTQLTARIPSLRHPRSHQPQLPDPLLERPLSADSLQRMVLREGRSQFGTLGRGNHFLELQVDEADGRLFLMVHSGSRALGQAIRQYHKGHSTGDHHRSHFVPQPSAAGTVRGRSRSRPREELAHGEPRERSRTAKTELIGIETESPAGRNYIDDVAWAVDYAQRSRLRMVEQAAHAVFEITGARPDPDSYFDCAHNTVQRERCGEYDWWVHRKGAVSARADELGAIPGSMGTASFHVRGRGEPRSLQSSSHGAGRRMSRTAAARSISIRDLHRQTRGVWFDHRRASQLREEAPGAYRDIHRVMRAQHELTRIVRRLRPLLSYKG